MIANLAFRRKNAHLTWFLYELSILLNFTSLSLLRVSNSFMQNDVRDRQDHQIGTFS